MAIDDQDPFAIKSRDRGKELEQFDKNYDREARQRGFFTKDTRQKGEWESSNWNGSGNAFWPEEYDDHQPGEGTAAIDLNELGLAQDPNKDDDVFNRPKAEISSFDSSGRRSKRRNAVDDEFDRLSGQGDNFNDDFGGGGFDTFGAGGEGTAALDISQFQTNDDAFTDDAPSAGTRRKVKERIEDGRNGLRKEGKGNKAFDANIYADGPEDGDFDAYSPPSQRDNYGADPEYARRQAAQPIGAPPAQNQPPAELAPHERTQAIDVSDFNPTPSNTPQPPPAAAPAERTMAVDLDTLLGGGGPPPSSDDPNIANARTQALDMPSTGGGGLPPSLNSNPTDNSTTVLDTNDLNAPPPATHTDPNANGKLIIFLKNRPPEVFPLRPGITNVGRETHNHLVLEDRFVSRKHLRIKYNSPLNKYQLTDTSNGNNAILINQQPLSMPLHNLQFNDEIVVGSTVLRFVRGNPKPEHYTPPHLPEDRSEKADLVNQTPSRPHTEAFHAVPNQPPPTAQSLIPGFPNWALGLTAFFIVGIIALIVVLIIFFI